jgi:hypothetical protein
LAKAQTAARVVASANRISSPRLVPNAQADRAVNSNCSTDVESEEVYYTPEEVVQRWRDRIDIDTLRNWRSRRLGPSYHRFGRVVLYHSDLLAEWETKNMIVCDPLAVTNSEPVEV